MTNAIKMIFPSSRDQVEASRHAICLAVNDRVFWEMEHNAVPADLASVTDYLFRFIKRVEKIDAFTLAYFGGNPVDFERVFTSHRRSNACFNVYALPKTLAVARALNGSALSGDVADEETIAGVVLAMGRGVTLQKLLANAVNDHMNRPGKRGSYSSGGTQASSALRALEALGVVRNTGGNNWGVAHAGKFERMLDAARGVSNTAD